MIKSILLGGVVLIIILIGVFFFNQQETELAEAPAETNEEQTERTPEEENEEEEGTVVVYTQGSSYSPGELTIQKGGRVTFRNESDREMWTASAIHPTHTVYPGSDIQKCFDGSDRILLFDACEEIAPGQEWSFVFKEVGTWRYHDHLNPAVTGTIIVEE